MALSEAQLFGHSDNVQELFRKAQKELEAGNVDVEGALADMEAAHKAAVQANAVQEEAKRKALESTEDFLAKKRTLFVVVSSSLDQAIGAVRKDTIAAKNFRKLRSDIQRATTQEEIDAVPVPIPHPPTELADNR